MYTEIEDDVSEFMTTHKLYDAKLHQILIDNSVDLATLQDIKQEEVEQFITAFELDKHFKQKVRFKQLMRTIHADDAPDVDESQENKRTNKTLKKDATTTVVLVGDSGCGKTSLMNKYCRDYFAKLSSSLGPKCSKDLGTYVQKLADGTNMEIVVWDTAGQEYYQSVCRRYYKKGDVILYCYDMSASDPFKTEAYWRKAIEDNAQQDVVVVMVGCKYDLVVESNADLYEKNKKRGETLIKEDEWKKFKTLHGECSAKTGHNVTEVFVTAAELVAPVIRAKKEEREKAQKEKIDLQNAANNKPNKASGGCPC